MPNLNMYVNGLRVERYDFLQEGVSGFLWGKGVTIPVTVFYDENWGKFLLATENEDYNNPRLYEQVMKSDNEDLKSLIMPKEFYYMAEPPESGSDDFEIPSDSDLIDKMLSDSDEAEICDDDDFYIPFDGDTRKRFSSISDDRQAEIIADVICKVGKETEIGRSSAFITFDSEIEADLGQTAWPRSARMTKTTVNFFTDIDDEKGSKTTALSVVNKKQPETYSPSSRDFSYSKYEPPSPFPELEPADDGIPVPCHKTFLS